MSNKSYNLSKSNKVKDIQGGEIKVMKKFLSIALSTAMAFSMFASVAFGADKELTTQDKYDALTKAGIFSGYPDGTAGLDKNMTRGQFAKVVAKLLTLEDDAASASKYVDVKANNWAAPFIGSVSKAGLMEGSKNQKGQLAFDFNGNVTVEQMAKVLVIALKLEVPATAENGASVWAKGYVDAAVKAGLIPADANFKAAATREQLVLAAYTASVEIEKQKVTYEVKVVDANNIQVTFSDAKDKPESFKLEKALEANKENTVTVKRANGQEKTLKFTWTITDATKVESVKAENLKEIVVTFDGEVDKVSAGEVDNYTIDGVSFKDAAVAKDGKSVTLALAKGSNLVNQKDYKLTVDNIKAGSKTINVKDFKFAPIDNTLPTVTAVEALGNTAIKVTFNEPVKNPTAANFLLDGKTVSGFVANPDESKTIVLKTYAKLADGEHTLTTKEVADFRDFKALTQETKFTVVEDKTAPTIDSVVKATFEKVQIKFSETVDPSTVAGGNVYWMQGSSKKYAGSTVTQISSDTFEFDFSANKMQYAADLYITGVKDYSGNAIASDSKIQVKPEVDQTRPEVVKASLNDSRNEITIKFNKSLENGSAKASSNYVIKDADGKEVSKLKDVSMTDSKTVKVNLVQALGEGKVFTLEISGVTDNTTLKNVMLPYSKTLQVNDTTAPTVQNAVYVENGNKIVVSFSEAMELSGEGSITDHAKYTIYNSKGKWVKLTDVSVSIYATSDKKAAIITFPSDIDVKTIQKIRVQQVNDAAGNVLDGLLDTKNVESPAAVTLGDVNVTANNKIELNFNSAIEAGSVAPSDFEVKAGTSTKLDVVSAVADGKKVILTLSDAFKLNDDATLTNTPVTVTVKDKANTVSLAGVVISPAADKAVTDKIAAQVKTISATTATYEFGIEFTEALDLASISGEAAKKDIKVLDKDGDAIDSAKYTLSLSPDKKTLVVTLTDKVAKNSGVLTVSVESPRYLQDVKGNTIATFTGYQVNVKG